MTRYLFSESFDSFGTGKVRHFKFGVKIYCGNTNVSMIDYPEMSVFWVM